MFAATAAVAHYPVNTGLSARVLVVDGVNAGRETSGYLSYVGYTLTDLEPGTMTLRFTTSGYQEAVRTVDVQKDTTLDVGLEPGPWPGFAISGIITTEWGERIDTPGVEAVRDGRVYGGGSYPGPPGVSYWIPTLPAGDYVLRVVKGGYLGPQPQPTVTLTRDTTLDIVLKRTKVLLFGTVREAAPCTGAIEGVEVKVVSGPDTGIGTLSAATGYRTSKTINWGQFRVRASKTGYVPVEVALDVPYPGSSCDLYPTPPGCNYEFAPENIEQNFVLPRTNSC
ncbi:MAG TPA: hypothetical protein VGF24_30600 [Vicinamibacterales bacterium]